MIWADITFDDYYDNITIENILVQRIMNTVRVYIFLLKNMYLQ